MRFKPHTAAVAGQRGGRSQRRSRRHRARPCIERRSEPPPLRAPAKGPESRHPGCRQNGGPNRAVTGPSIGPLGSRQFGEKGAARPRRTWLRRSWYPRSGVNSTSVARAWPRLEELAGRTSGRTPRQPIALNGPPAESILEGGDNLMVVHS